MIPPSSWPWRPPSLCLQPLSPCCRHWANSGNMGQHYSCNSQCEQNLPRTFLLSWHFEHDLGSLGIKLGQRGTSMNSSKMQGNVSAALKSIVKCRNLQSRWIINIIVAISFHFDWHSIFSDTRRYSPLRWPTSISCGGLPPSAKKNFAKKRAYYAV